MPVRLDMKEGLKAELHSWHWEASEKLYPKLKPIYKKICDVHDIDEIIGPYWKDTSAIGATELLDVTPSGQSQEDKPIEGYPVYALIKEKSLKVKCPRNLKRDWHRTKDWLKDYVQKNWPKAVEVTKDKIITALFNNGGLTAGHSVFNNDDADANLTTYTNPLLCYDAAPMFNRSDNTRTAKNGSTYYNGTALANITYANALTMWKLYTDTNAYMENGNPFDNTQDIVIMAKQSLVPDWTIVNESTLNPDNANNPKNPLKGVFKDVIANPYLTTANFSCMIQEQCQGLIYFLGGPQFDFWVRNDPEVYYAKVIVDHAEAMRNFRFMVGNNAPLA